LELVVCCKRVPDTSEAEVAIDASGRDIRRERLAFTINEADNYALEEALLIKEKLGGTVTLVTTGPKESDEVLRMGLAKGADKAVRVTDDKIAGSDALGLARILAKVIAPLKPDLVLTGSQASDDGQAQVGVMLGELLGLPHAAYVSKLGLKESGIGAGNVTKVLRELEGGLLEALELPLPAVITVQTGINQPRYASIMGIKRAQAKELKVLDAAAAGLADCEIGDAAAQVKLEKLYVPVVESHAEILQGDVNEASARLAGVLKEKGLV
jgi:electron transfer flavoprotein beta subunit